MGKALVIGVSGQVGSAIKAVLEREGIETVGTHGRRPESGSRSLDVRDGRAVELCFNDVKPSVAFIAVNPPGGVDHCERNPEECFATIVAGTRNIVASAAKHKTKLVYYSSDYVFDGASGPNSEEDPPRPLNVYGQAKVRAEEAVREDSPEHLILRTTAVFSWKRPSANFAMQVWETLQAGKPLRVPSDQWGNPTLAEYLAEATLRLVSAGEKGTFNVVGKDRIPRSELAALLAKAMGLDPRLIVLVATTTLGQAAARPLQGGLKTEKMRRVLGTEPLALDEALKRLTRQWRRDTHVKPAGGASTAQRTLKDEILQAVKRYHAAAHRPDGFIPFKSRVQYAGRVFGETELVNLVDSSLDFWLTLGPYGDLFEQKMRGFFGSRDFIMVNSGSTANLTAVMALMSAQRERALKPGDEVITPAVTFPTTVAPLVHSGLIPVFVDCEVGTYNIDPRRIEGAISSKTRALFIPHTLGNPCDMDAIMDIARRRRLFLIEDACDALGSRFRGKLVGTFGELATLSFFPAHHITTGEGGGVIVNDPALSRIVRSVRDWGRDCWCAPGETNTCGKRFGWELGGLPCGYDHKYIYSNLGYNFKPTDMQAAIGAAQADRIPDFTQARRRNFNRLYQGLERFSDHLVLPTLDPRSEPSWFGLPITVRGVARGELVGWLENANIETRQVFGGNILKQPGYRNIQMRQSGTLEQTDRIMRDTFFIGVYPGLTEEMIDFVLERFTGFFAARAHHSNAGI